MSLAHSYVIPYTADSNFDEISVYDALEEYLTVEHTIRFAIKIPRNKAPQLKTDQPLSPEMVRRVERLVNRTGRRSSRR
ncbi:hypothetical protein B0T25DRAFT_570180 [Lasiosphaeria hispida]|uniref:Uncharacterized protein n=1 Tax=Lasiosphaeria hispida TaxID=260671 RepID=A0AAJ0HET9_9PEZI|nr:hypothetical protein B0T25DRAFT_570180 [Lasiosphaeria hispida]